MKYSPISWLGFNVMTGLIIKVTGVTVEVTVNGSESRSSWGVRRGVVRRCRCKMPTGGELFNAQRRGFSQHQAWQARYDSNNMWKKKIKRNSWRMSTLTCVFFFFEDFLTPSVFVLHAEIYVTSLSIMGDWTREWFAYVVIQEELWFTLLLKWACHCMLLCWYTPSM